MSLRSISGYLTDIDRQIREERKEKIFQLWLSCHTQEEIAEAVGMPRQTVSDEIRVLPDLEALPKSAKLSALYVEPEFSPPIYNGRTDLSPNGEKSDRSPVGFCEYCQQPIFEPYCMHAGRCEAYKRHMAGGRSFKSKNNA